MRGRALPFKPHLIITALPAIELALLVHSASSATPTQNTIMLEQLLLSRNLVITYLAESQVWYGSERERC